MKNIYTALLLVFFAAPAFAEVPHELLKKEGSETSPGKLFEGGNSFSYSSDEADPSESLNRVAGEIDLGFAKPEQTFKSEKQRMGLDKVPDSTRY